MPMVECETNMVSLGESVIDFEFSAYIENLQIGYQSSDLMLSLEICNT